MINVWVTGPGGDTIIRRAQIVGDAPAPGTYWARTCDGPPAAWLLVEEHNDGQAVPAYNGTEYRPAVTG